ncbi:hypothetical protein VD0004_g3567 [Verticillium dahliae]|nr:hypothetical protein VD0004_g3567 [Verticillium dahliae]
MVGVPGKYKGCETCRARRVKCDNQRPKCKRCIDGGRECAGYERERVFIMATVDDAGRCSSHPPRHVSSSASSSKKGKSVTPERKKGKSISPETKKSKSNSPEGDVMELAAMEPLAPAWDDLLFVENKGVTYLVQMTVLQVNVQNIGKGKKKANAKVALTPYAPSGLYFLKKGRELEVSAHSLVSLSSPDEDNGSLNGTFTFLFDVMLALLNKKMTFLAEEAWCTTPWEYHPKSVLDFLLDTLVLLPGVFSRADLITPKQATLARRLEAQELLYDCLAVESQLDGWYAPLNPASDPAYWAANPAHPSALPASQPLPFADAFSFRDSTTALALITYWTATLLFRATVDRVHAAVCAPVLEDFQDMYADLSPTLQIDTNRYRRPRDYAARICRSLEFALGAGVQVDALVAPLAVAHGVFRETNAVSADGALEMLWCEGFREKLVAEGQRVAQAVMDQRWVDLGQF